MSSIETTTTSANLPPNQLIEYNSGQELLISKITGKFVNVENDISGSEQGRNAYSPDSTSNNRMHYQVLQTKKYFRLLETEC